MSRARPMTILAATADELRRFFQAEISRIVRIKLLRLLLRLPAGDVAAQAFGIVVPGNAGPRVGRRDERIRGVGMLRLRPFLHRLRMTLTTLRATDEFATSRMRLR